MDDFNAKINAKVNVYRYSKINNNPKYQAKK